MQRRSAGCMSRSWCRSGWHRIGPGEPEGLGSFHLDAINIGQTVQTRTKRNWNHRKHISCEPVRSNSSAVSDQRTMGTHSRGHRRKGRSPIPARAFLEPRSWSSCDLACVHLRHRLPFLKSMRRNLGLALLVGCLGGLPAGAALSRRVVAYRIHAELDPQKKIVIGRETLTWTNDSPDAVGELQFHLYLNAFQNEKSSFMRESAGQLRGARATKGS